MKYIKEKEYYDPIAYRVNGTHRFIAIYVMIDLASCQFPMYDVEVAVWLAGKVSYQKVRRTSNRSIAMKSFYNRNRAMRRYEKLIEVER